MGGTFRSAGQLASSAAKAITTGSAGRANIANAMAQNNAAMAANFNLQAMKQQQEFNAAEARANREWQEKMSNTAYQRAVKDLERAGLNPALAYQQGGAGTPSGSSASSSARSMSTPQTFMEQITALTAIADALNAVGGILGTNSSAGIKGDAQNFMNDIMKWWENAWNDGSQSQEIADLEGLKGSERLWAIFNN